MYEKIELYKNDDLELIFRNFRNKTTQFEEYIVLISEHFNKQEEVTKRFTLLKETCDLNYKPNPKFNFKVLCSWYPGLDQNMVGKIIGKMKSKHSGIRKEAFEDWINETEIEDIKIEAEACRTLFGRM